MFKICRVLCYVYSYSTQFHALNCFIILHFHVLKMKLPNLKQIDFMKMIVIYNGASILSYTNIYQIILVHFYNQKRSKRFKLKSHSKKFCNEYVCFQNFTFLLCQLFDKNTFLQFSVLIIPRRINED